MSTPSAPATREQFSGQLGFLLSAIGSAVGLGNIWRFPGVAYANGGGAFLIPYLVALLTAGIPILLLEYGLGHRYRGSAPAVFRRVGKKFESLGWFQVAISLSIMFYYIIVLAWAASYLFFSVNLAWGDDPVSFLVGDYLQVSDPGFTLAINGKVLLPTVLLWVFVYLALRGSVRKGLEVVNKIAIPLLVVMFLTLVVRAIFLPGATEGLNAFFTPNWPALMQPGVWIAAYTQIFFSLSVTFGIMITYSSYLKARANLVPVGLVAAFANSSFELLAGFGVFATLGFMATTQGVPLDDLSLTGVGLSFMTFPTVISTMPGGPIFGVLFFGSLLLAGFTSMVSITEVVIAAIREKFALSRATAVGAIVGVGVVVSVVVFTTTNGLNALDVVDNFTNNIGVAASAVVEVAIIAFIARLLPTLQHHLNQTSTLQLAGWWRIVIMINPFVLAYVLVVTIIGLLTEGYDVYPMDFLGLFGWGTVALMVIFAVVATVLPWRTEVDRFTPLPLDPYTTRSGKEIRA
ncbi:MAG: sodium-dependent transporter [Propioniciclava sp.]